MVTIPRDFELFTGHDGLVEKVHDGLPFSVEFGSQLDQAAAGLFKMYNAYNNERETDSKEIKTPIFPILNSYIEQVIEISTPIM